MSNLKSLQDAIAGLNQKFGGGVTEDNPIKKVLFKQPKYVNKRKKWAKPRMVAEHNKTVVFQHINKNDMQRELRDHLKFLRYNYVLSGFYYQGSEMDMFAMANEKVIEFEIKTDPEDFGNDFKKLYSLGKIRVNKHSYLEAGKALPNFFYFVVPYGMLTPEDVPGHCGLITATKHRPFAGDLTTNEGLRTISFQIDKTAPLLKPEYAPATIYKHIAQKCYLRYDELLRKRGCFDTPLPDVQKHIHESSTAS